VSSVPPVSEAKTAVVLKEELEVNDDDHLGRHEHPKKNRYGGLAVAHT